MHNCCYSGWPSSAQSSADPMLARTHAVFVGAKVRTPVDCGREHSSDQEHPLSTAIEVEDVNHVAPLAQTNRRSAQPL